MTPASFEPASYLIKDEIYRIKTRTMFTHVVAKNAAINFKISVSLLMVSSKPGVSMRMTGRLSRTNSFANWTSAVHDSKFLPTRRFEPLAKLIN